MNLKTAARTPGDLRHCSEKQPEKTPAAVINTRIVRF